MKNIDGKIEIRKADAADAKLIRVLGAVTFFEAYFEQDDANDLANYIHESFDLEKIRAEIEDKNAVFFIIYFENHAVGYAKLRENSKAECIKTENSIELQRIYIVERVFGKGIGEQLLKHCLETAKAHGFETLWLGVWEKNKRAQKFYAKHGFKRVGELEYPYGETVGINFALEKVL
jgi:ribosomal protein S18 acetylase RimI-like enzyme